MSDHDAMDDDDLSDGEWHAKHPDAIEPETFSGRTWPIAVLALCVLAWWLVGEWGAIRREIANKIGEVHYGSSEIQKLDGDCVLVVNGAEVGRFTACQADQYKFKGKQP